MLRLAGIGLTAGIFSSLFGVGGGIVIVPLLVLVAHFAARQAVPVSLGAIGITAVAGVIAYAFRGEVRPAYAALVGIPAAVGAFGGVAWQRRVSSRSLLLAFAALLVVVAIWLLVG